MSQLKAFLEALDPLELEKVVLLRKIGKEKKVFDFFKSRLGKEFLLNQKILQKLELTESHFNKACSVLLKKCYAVLYPKSGLDFLYFLKQKNLLGLFTHEIWQNEKNLQGLSPSKEISDYYLKVFHWLIDLPFTHYDEKLTSYIGKRYLDALVERTPAWEQYVECHILFSDINRLSAKKNKKARLQLSLSYLLQKEKELESSAYFLAKYYTYRSLCSYYLYLEPNPHLAQTYLEKAIALKANIAWFYPINIAKFLDLLYADILFFNCQIDQSYTIYHTVFSQPLEKEIYGFYYHCEQFVLVNILKENYAAAESALQTYFDDPIKQKLDIFATRGAMSYAKLYLSTGQLKEAIHSINLAREINETASYHPFEFQIKMLELFYFFLKGDFEFAEHLCTRNIKTILANPETKRHKNYLSFYRICLYFITCILKRKTIGEKQLNEYTEVDLSMQNLYVNLPKKLLEKTIEQVNE